MGMVGCFVPVTDATLERLRSGEESIEEFLYPDDGESEPEGYVDLDKAWHGIHYLLTGEADGGTPPLALAVFGGEEFGPEIGYGPARFLTATQAAEVAEALEATSVDALTARFDAQDMEQKQIYPDVIWMRDGTEALDYLLDNYQQLVTFYRAAAARGDAVIQWLG
ncbi:MAG TPA: YfbM family protein [Roseateles sp.]